MSKEKRTFFERLTGSAPESAEENSYNPLGGKNEENGFIAREEDYDTEDGQLAIDVLRGDNEIIVQSVVAGVKPEDLDISIDKNSVSIKGKRENNRLTDRENAVCQELYWGGFSRTISLSDEMDSENSEAIIKNGILTIRIPFAKKIKKQKIRVTEE